MIFDWNPTTSLLDQRDRFTRAEIQRDFEAQPDLHRLDVDGGLFATPVSNNRYVVIWRSLGDRIEVKAVVATQLKGEDPITLRAKLQQVIKTESYGKLTLD